MENSTDIILLTPPGLEDMLAEDVRRAPPVLRYRRRGEGFVIVSTSTDSLSTVRAAFADLRLADSALAYVGELTGIQGEREEALGRIRAFGSSMPVSSAVALARAWGAPVPETPSFRISCDRSGTHKFTSVDVGKELGGGVVEQTSWPVSLKVYDLNICALVMEDVLIVGVLLTGGASRAERPRKGVTDVREAARTTLRRSMCNALLRLAGVSRGDIVCDPMCGSGALVCEATTIEPLTFSLGGDIAEGCASAAGANCIFPGAPCRERHLIAGWDVTALPLRDSCIDCIAVDMPFGRMCGSWRQNRRVYPRALREMSRVLRKGGTAVLLTLERKVILRCLEQLQPVLFECVDERRITMGYELFAFTLRNVVDNSHGG